MTVANLNGVVVDTPTRLDDTIRVSVPDLETAPRNTYGPLRFRPYIGGDGTIRLPARGDLAVVGIDTGTGEQWVIEWHRDDHTDPPYVISSGGGASGEIFRGEWKWTTGIGAPASGHIGMNAAPWTTATQVSISELTDPGTDISNIIALTMPGDLIYIQDKNDATKWGRFTLTAMPTDQGTWRSIPVTPLDNGALIANNSVSTVVMVRPATPGSAQKYFYVHDQATPATTWNVVHNLGFFPNVAPVDSINREFIADVTYTDVNNLVINLTAATAGKAYLS